MKNNPYFLQEYEVANYDADLTANTTKINEDNNNTKISMQED